MKKKKGREFTDSNPVDFLLLCSSIVVMFDDKLQVSYTMYQDLVTDKMYSKKQLLITVLEVGNFIHTILSAVWRDTKC
jgi:hypothetical protein